MDAPNLRAWSPAEASEQKEAAMFRNAMPVERRRGDNSMTGRFSIKADKRGHSCGNLNSKLQGLPAVFQLY
jgi:hypothetical protein